MSALSLPTETPAHAIVRVLGTTALALGLVLAAGMAQAQTACSTHAAISETLAAGYGESPVAGGLSISGDLVQVFATADGETWTLVRVRPDGTSCVIGAGRFWHVPTLPPTGPEA
jgi:hypothetical protein